MTDTTATASATAKNDEDSSMTQPTRTQKRFNFYNAEEVHRETAPPKTEEELKKESRRFNFYNAAEVNQASPPPPSHHHKRTNSQPSVLTEEPVVVPSVRSASARKTTTASAQDTQSLLWSPKSDIAVVEGDLDSKEILKSLQASEKTRRRIRKGSAQRTPHTAVQQVIKKESAAVAVNDSSVDAGTTLPNAISSPQNGESTNGESDTILQARMEERRSESREAEKRARQERIAKYASRVVEMESIPMVDSNEPDDREWIPIPPGSNSDDAEELIRMRSSSDDYAVDSKESVTDVLAETDSMDDPQPDTSVVSAASREEDMQRGVEQVLMAILERANSGPPDTKPDNQSELNALSLAMASLMQPSLSFETGPTVRHRRPNRRESEQKAIDKDEGLQGVPSKQSVVDELLEDQATVIKSTDNMSLSNGIHDEQPSLQQAEKDNAKLPISNSSSSHGLTPSSTRVNLNSSPQSTLSKDVLVRARSDPPESAPDDESEDEREFSLENPSFENSGIDTSFTDTELDDDDDEDDEDDADEEDEDDEDDDDEDDGDAINASMEESTLSNVLGPLSSQAGGTTGVVLEGSEATIPGPPEEEAASPVVAALSPSSLYQSLSSAVRDAESFVSYMAGYQGSKDKYSTHDEDEAPGVFVPYDDEAYELMRSLCAHLLPTSTDPTKSPKLDNPVPVWDEDNPDEAGYRIIRLTKLQLRRVEREFDHMIRSVKKDSERRLKKNNSKKSEDEDDWNGVSKNDFARDLEEAEKLLDQEEERVEKANRELNIDDESGDESEDESEGESDGSESESYSRTSASGTFDDTKSATVSEDEETLVTSHPDFPGVKIPGRGEIGDLEFFHLPIIYKSKVTGFEPTKDMFLEPGNVVAGQYLVESELGSAAFSTAYRCVDLSSDTTNEEGEEVHEEVCLKVIKNTKDFFDQSLDEIKILELLRQTGKCHENYILEMKTFFYHREHLIIVTELLRQNLFEFGKFITDNDEEPYFTQQRLCYITRQVLIALDFVHQLGLVHSDVKPENILLSSYSRAQIKLIDFGSSCYLTDRQSSYIQSRSYRAPEVVLGMPYDGKIDIWSLGCVVAEMYTGEVTFQNDSIVSMLSRIEAICGPFPRHMIAQGRQSGRFFTKSGLLFEHVESGNNDNDSPSQSHLDGPDKALLDVFQPKRTTMAARLGITEVTSEDEAQFVDFCSKLLSVDPESRPSASEALKHPWIAGCESFDEEDIKYPSN